ncbi:radical SAM protein [Methanococcoides sp. FTZ1]|uniref:radical SAM protein n=1 Tax=Methanococcoides sp. FTZ1 TaxID=3439061 RepID=UPI003F87B792
MNNNMNGMVRTDTGSFYTYLTKGCKLCQQGAKMVLFITGICNRGCFYCPLSEERKKDDTYANERLVKDDEDVIEEAMQMDALGTGITGGEPLIRADLVIHYIKLLKERFGRDHHIHLYTSIAPDKDLLESLSEAGLDEIRFHPPEQLWKELKGSDFERAIKDSIELGMETGMELPSIDGVINVRDVVIGTDCFLNLNELEFSDTNAMEMKERNFLLRDDMSNAVEGSENFAAELVEEIPKIHFCSSRYKDAGQLRERLLRTARKTARQLDEITEEGTIVYGSIEGQEPGEIISILHDLEVPDDLIEAKENAVELPWWIVEEIAEELKEEGLVPSIIERYPFKDGLIVEVIPL